MIPDGHRTFLIILDGVGAGEAADAAEYGDVGSDTLGNLSRVSGGLNLPVFQSLGLGNIKDIQGVEAVMSPLVAHGLMTPLSAGKDSVTGHWEICGIRMKEAFPTFSRKFPDEVVKLVESVSGRKVIGNEVASGTEIMDRLGAEHCKTGALILYTSADSVLQILAHEEVVPLEELYRTCEEIHKRLESPNRVARVIARPFVGQAGSFVRTPNRYDYALTPPEETVLDILQQNSIPVTGIGKVDTLFGARGFSSAFHTKNNEDGINRIREAVKSGDPGMYFANLIDFDMLWGHRNNIVGFKDGLEYLDSQLQSILNLAREEDLFFITADHGNDPTTPSTDHSRENVPLLSWKGETTAGINLGKRTGFSDIAATIAEHFQVPWSGPGLSFLSQL